MLKHSHLLTSRQEWRARQLMQKYPKGMVNFIFFTDEKVFTVAAPTNSQNDWFCVSVQVPERRTSTKTDCFERDRRLANQNVYAVKTCNFCCDSPAIWTTTFIRHVGVSKRIGIVGIGLYQFLYQQIIGYHFCTPCRNLMRFGSVTPEFKT